MRKIILFSFLLLPISFLPANATHYMSLRVVNNDNVSWQFSLDDEQCATTSKHGRGWDTKKRTVSPGTPAFVNVYRSLSLDTCWLQEGRTNEKFYNILFYRNKVQFGHGELRVRARGNLHCTPTAMGTAIVDGKPTLLMATCNSSDCTADYCTYTLSIK